MPLYDYKCRFCQHEFTAFQRVEDYLSQRCEKCGWEVSILIGKVVAHNFRSGWYEHIAPEPIYCNSPQELRDACDAHNARSVYLEDSTFRTSPGPDPQAHCGADVYAERGSICDDYSKNVSSQAARSKLEERSSLDPRSD